MSLGEDFQKTKEFAYLEACQTLELAETEEEYKIARSKFMAIVDYRDSRAKVGGIENLLKRRKKPVKN